MSTPEEAFESVSLPALAQEQLAKAREAHSGRATVRVGHGPGDLFRHVLAAITAGHALSDHANPGEASVQVVVGRARLEWSNGSWEGGPGDFATIPPERHALVALEDCAILLTVAHGRHDG